MHFQEVQEHDIRVPTYESLWKVMESLAGEENSLCLLQCDFTKIYNIFLHAQWTWISQHMPYTKVHV
jgi:hypothetical protein